MKIVVTGLMAQYPFGGVIWDYIQYVLGFHALGHEVWYLEDSGVWPYDPVNFTYTEDCSQNVLYLNKIMTEFGFADRWIYRNGANGEFHGAGEGKARELLKSGDLLVDVSGAGCFRDYELTIGHKMFLDGDPMFTQIGLYDEAKKEHAERVRRIAFEQLLATTDPLPWNEPCLIVVHSTAESFAAAVGVEPVAIRGATSIEFLAQIVSSRQIDVMGDGDETVPDALAHELVHVVLADHFSRLPPPRWADEGMAVLFDSLLKQQRHNSDLQHAVKHGQTWSAGDLAALEDYPDSLGRQQVFYGQSAALVRWLLAEKGAATFLRFVDDSSTIGFSAALQDHYGLDAVADLEPAWRQGIPLEELVTTAGSLR